MAEKVKIEIINHPNLGKVILRKNVLSKNISIRIKPSGEIILTYPSNATKCRALNFLDTKQHWIKQRIEQFIKIRQQNQLVLPLKTRLFEIKPCDRLPACKFDRVIFVEITPDKDEEAVQNEIRQVLKSIWKKEAELLLPRRVDILARKFGFNYGKVTFRDNRTRWGSCSVCNNISLNINVMQLPDELIDYIIIHELCHTVHKNHGREFHLLVNKCTNGAEFELRKMLKNYASLK